MKDRDKPRDDTAARILAADKRVAGIKTEMNAIRGECDAETSRANKAEERYRERDAQCSQLLKANNELRAELVKAKAVVAPPAPAAPKSKPKGNNDTTQVA